MEKKKRSHAELLELSKRADKGDVEANRELVQLGTDLTLDDIRKFGLAESIRRILAMKVAPEEALHTLHNVRQEARLVADSMLGLNPSELEKLLAEQISLDWFALRVAEVSLASTEQVSFKDAYWRQSRVDTAHNRLMSSIRTLAQIRRLQIPSLIQLNVATKQVNIAPATH